MTRRFGLNGRDPVSECGDGAGEVRFAELINALALALVSAGRLLPGRGAGGASHGAGRRLGPPAPGGRGRAGGGLDRTRRAGAGPRRPSASRYTDRTQRLERGSL